MSTERYDYEKLVREIESRYKEELDNGEHITITEDDSIQFLGRSIERANVGHCILENGENPESINPTIPRHLGKKGYSSRIFSKNNKKYLEIWKSSLGTIIPSETRARPFEFTDGFEVSTPELLKILSDKTNLEIINLLKNEPSHPRKISEILGMQEAYISRVLSQLEKIGILRSRWVYRDRNVKLYSVDTKKINIFFEPEGLKILIRTREEKELSISYDAFTFDVPEVPVFVGREKEMKKLEHFPFIVIEGMPGIGKTYLAAKFVQKAQREGKRIFWHTFTEIDSFHYLINKISVFLNNVGYSNLLEYIKQEGKDDMVLLSLVQEGISDDMVLCFDGFEQVRDEKIIALFRLLKNVKGKIIITSRVRPPFLSISRTDIAETKLSALNEKETHDLLTSRGVILDDGFLKKAHQMLGGHPLILDMFCEAIREKEAAEVLKNLPVHGVEDHLWSEIFEKLSENDRELVECLSMFRAPVSSNILMKIYKKDRFWMVLKGLERRMIIKKQDGKYILPSVIKEFAHQKVTNKKELHKEIAQCYLEEGNPKELLEAMYHFSQAGEPEKAAEVADLLESFPATRPEDHLQNEILKNLEHEARSLIGDQDYSRARSILKQVIELVPERKQSLQSEFGFLYDFTTTVQKDERRWNKNKELIEWRTNLWYVLSDRNNFPLEVREESRKDVDLKTSEGSSIDVKSIKIIEEPSLESQEKGEILERAVLELFHQFFIIAEEDENIILQKLRQQKKGTQFGHDISFECVVEGNENVKCHIECRFKKDNITLKDIADKLLSTKRYWKDLDHWILINPNSKGISNELDNLLSSWRERKEYPFEIQIWCPDTGVNEFFGLSPDVYDLFYKPKEDETHPRQWSEEKRLRVFQKWKQKLIPSTRLPKEWEEYMLEPFRMCMKGEDRNELEILYQHYVPMRYMDERKNIIGQSLEEYVIEWLENAKKSVMFLLGEFGDGKTAFTYILSCNLAKEFFENPSNGWIPIRFALKDYHSAGNSQEFLRMRLEEFGADIAGWNRLKTQNNLLIILDGFDEMTKKLDSNTITQNIKDLIECCGEFEGLKILITSRTHFFENQRDVKRLLQRLPSSVMCYLAPIDRPTNIKHLERFTTTPDEKKKLGSIRKLHDPIGLAAKPLFLQMIKETLNELPEENLDEVTLYETYIGKSLNRKISQLDDKEKDVLPREIFSNLVKILEQIALKLQGSEENYISLAEFPQNLAELLWNMSDSSKTVSELVEEKEKTVEDATARIGVRSLLTRVKTEDDTCKWPVDFCHRSMREFFVAKGICRALREGIGEVEKYLTELPLNHEILYFTAKLMGRNEPKKCESRLLELVESTRGTRRDRSPGGNAVTLLFWLKGELPGYDWSGLNLDYADLSGADLSNKDFHSTSLHYANLDNVNLEGADFSRCDLTGVRIEETTAVLAVAVRPFLDQIVAAYGDNTIREWNIAQQLRGGTRIICKNTNGPIKWMGIHFGSDLCAVTNEEVIFYDFGDQGELIQRAHFRMKSGYRQVVAKRNFLLLVSEEHETSRVLLVDLQQRKIASSIEFEKFALCENFDYRTYALSDGKTYLNIVRTANSHKETAINLASHEVASLCVHYCEDDDKYLLACGQRDGKVLVWQICKSRDKWQDELLLEKDVHEGLVSSLVFLDDSTIASGGIDRRICIIKLETDVDEMRDAKERVLHLTVKCRNMKIDGVRGDKERKMLQELVSKAQKSTDL